MSKQIGQYRKYSPSKLATAVQMVTSGSMSKKKAAATFGIPRSTLIDKISGKAPLGMKSGRSTVLTTAEETVLVDYCKLMASIGYPLKRYELLQEVKRVLDHDGRTTPFRENLPGKDWYYGFCKRHPDIAERSAMALGYQRAIINEEMINGWFSNLLSYLKKEIPDFENMIRDPRRVFNADESGFPLCVNTGKVLAEKGVRHVYQVSSSNKQQITVMACLNAIGDFVPPLIVYPGERFRESGIEDFPEALYGHTKNGWMDTPLFVEFLKLLNTFVKDRSIPKPVILYVDGHSTHMSLLASKFCNENEIVLYCLLPNATHILQACDVGFFGPMKSVWKRQVKQWHIEHLGESFTKKYFPSVFRKTWYLVTKIENAVHGFQRCGLFPLNASAIDMTKLTPSKVHVMHSVAVPGSNSNIELSPNSSSETSISNGNSEQPELTPDIPLSQEPARPSCSSAVEGAALHSVKSCLDLARVGNIVSNDRDKMVSQSFAILSVPEIKKPRGVNILRNKLPKALSGTEALKMLKEREDAKRTEEEAKKKRKEERELKRKQKLEEKERKQREKEQQKQKRKAAKSILELKKKTKRRRSDSSSSSDACEEPIFQDSDDDFDEKQMCPGCSTDDGDSIEWINCTSCPRRWHISCTGDAILCEIPFEQLANYPFVCELCLE